jgi:hypothetical protein
MEKPMDNETTGTLESAQGDADMVTKQNVQIGTLTAQNVSIKDSAVGSIKGDSVTARIENGVIGAVVASRVDVTVTNGALGAVVAQGVTVKDSNVNILIAGQVSGNARILFDMRAGLLTGLAAGLVMVAFGLLQGRRAK